jgi:hypothetical protein
MTILVLTRLARLAASRRSTPLAMARAGLLVTIALGGSANAAHAAGAGNGTGTGTGTGTGAGNAATAVDPLIHSQTSDRYVNGKYDKTGTYIPPHYQPVAKPRFHGYFFNKEEGGEQAKNPIDPKPN